MGCFRSIRQKLLCPELVLKFVFVKYLGIEGKISEKSIGGVNTNLLPQGAKVKNIDTKNLKLTIDYENKNYMFEL